VGPIEAEGSLAASTSGASSASDLSDLGIDEESAVFQPRVDFAWGGMDVVVQSWSAEFAGTGSLTGDFDLGGTTIPAGDDVDTSIDLRTFDADVTWDVVPGDMVDLGLGLGIKLLDVDLRVTSLTTGDEVSTDEVVPLPVLALRGEVEVGDFALQADVSGLALDVSSVDVRVLDLDLAAAWRFGELGGVHGELALGWRSTDFELAFEDQGSEVDAELAFSGPFLGLTVGL
jgi:hypothetical protein